MIAALLLVLASGFGSNFETEKGEVNCEIDECPADVLKDLWLAEREARIEWETTATEHELVISDLRKDFDGSQRELAAARTARIATAAPVLEDPGIPTSCLVIGGISCAVCGAAGAGIAAAAE